MSKLVKIISSLLFDTKYYWHAAALLLLLDTLLNLVIVKKVKYTEIDWISYMQEVAGFLDGERNYYNLRGDTGPLVYPAGFVYIFSLFHYATDSGRNIQLAQYLYILLYLLTLLIVFYIYRCSLKIPPYVLIPLCLSKRIHSVYVLRLFNDPVAMIFIYLCILSMIKKRWTTSCLLYSLALSVKMNILLFFPAFGLLLFKALGLYKSILNVGYIILVQIALAYPFITVYPYEYLSRSFELTRVFTYKWTVNWKLLNENVFLSAWFAKLLLVCHFWVLMAFLFKKWCRSENGVFAMLHRGIMATSYGDEESRWLTANHITTVMFTSNFIGIMFSRTLHYQFYSWYFHSIPLILWHCTMIPITLRFVIMMAIEYCWNVYPATAESSQLLLLCHMAILMGLWSGDAEGRQTKIDDTHGKKN